MHLLFGGRLVKIIVVGPDGAGKTSVASELVRLLEQSGRLVEHRHWCPSVLPRPGRLVGRPQRPSDRPHEVRLHGRPMSSLLVFWFFLDFLVGDVQDTTRSLLRPLTLVVERGWLDLSVDPTRYRLTPASRLVERLGRMLRQPTALVVLAPDVAATSQRSAELSPKEIGRQIQQWRGNAARFGSSVVLEIGDRTIAEVAEEAFLSVVSAEQWRVLPSRRHANVVFRADGPKPRIEGVVAVPCTRRAAALNYLTKQIAHSRLRCLAPRIVGPPQSMINAVSVDGSSAVTARKTRNGNWIVVGRTDDGGSLIAKQDRDDEGAKLDRSEHLLRSTALRPPVLQATTSQTAGLLVTVAETATDKIRSTTISSDASYALGRMWRRSSSGFAHGDFVPWNLIPTASGLVLLDWEHAFDDAPPFYDIWHWVVQCHLLLRTATPHDWRKDSAVVAAFKSFAAAAELGDAQPADFLDDYLDVSTTAFPIADRAIEIRRQMLRSDRSGTCPTSLYEAPSSPRSAAGG